MIGNLESFQDELAASGFPPLINKLAGASFRAGSPPVTSGRCGWSPSTRPRAPASGGSATPPTARTWRSR
ncbi:hypothetical protein NKH18_01445 [Streptomyces sp. M10(2022)]